jgi:hypothetical protein
MKCGRSEIHPRNTSRRVADVQRHVGVASVNEYEIAGKFLTRRSALRIFYTRETEPGFVSIYEQAQRGDA